MIVSFVYHGELLLGLISYLLLN
uniref:Uncharacterized protein n=1 Tax=Rhizophora mucronata TaxID=61149 RepID=A0A2P2PA80_RHIMU